MVLQQTAAWWRQNKPQLTVHLAGSLLHPFTVTADRQTDTHTHTYCVVWCALSSDCLLRNFVPMWRRSSAGHDACKQAHDKTCIANGAGQLDTACVWLQTGWTKVVMLKKNITNARPRHVITCTLQMMSAVVFVSLLTAACCMQSVCPSLVSVNIWHSQLITERYNQPVNVQMCKFIVS